MTHTVSHRVKLWHKHCIAQEMVFSNQRPFSKEQGQRSRRSKKQKTPCSQLVWAETQVCSNDQPTAAHYTCCSTPWDWTPTKLAFSHDPPDHSALNWTTWQTCDQMRPSWPSTPHESSLILHKCTHQVICHDPREISCIKSCHGPRSWSFWLERLQDVLQMVILREDVCHP